MREDKQDAKLRRKIPTADIQQVKLIYDGSSQPGTSLQLTVKTRTFEFEASSERECQLWLRVFNIVVEMNKCGLSLRETNPFIFEEEQMKALQTGR
jgi:hypothetical protein